MHRAFLGGAVREKEGRPIDWLCPLNDTPQRKGVFRAVNLEDYFSLIDWLGREILPGKRGAIPKTLEPILQRLPIRSDYRLDTLDGYDKLFCCIFWACRPTDDPSERCRAEVVSRDQD